MSDDLPLISGEDRGEAGRVESVTEFTRRVKTLLERGIAPAWVRG